MIRLFHVTPPESAHLIEHDGPPTLAELYEWIGHTHTVEVIGIVCGDENVVCQLVIDENGKLHTPPLPINKFATILWHGFMAKQRAPLWAFEDFIVGNVVMLSGEHRLT